MCKAESKLRSDHTTATLGVCLENLEVFGSPLCRGASIKV